MSDTSSTSSNHSDAYVYFAIDEIMEVVGINEPLPTFYDPPATTDDDDGTNNNTSTATSSTLILPRALRPFPRKSQRGKLIEMENRPKPEPILTYEEKLQILRDTSEDPDRTIDPQLPIKGNKSGSNMSKLPVAEFHKINDYHPRKVPQRMPKSYIKGGTRKRRSGRLTTKCI